MLDVYERKEGSFEIVDTQVIELRYKRMLYYRLVRFVLILLVAVGITLILITIITSNLLWLFVLAFPIGFGILAYRNLQILKERLSPTISSVLLDFNKRKSLTDFRVRKWQQTEIDEYIEEEIRFNQAIGFKVIWYDDGSLDVDIIVDPNFPGTLIFETFDFYSIAELRNLFDTIIPELDEWYFEYEDGSEWDSEVIDELYEEIESTPLHWLIREYFSEL